MKNLFTHEELQLLEEMIKKELSTMPIEIHHTTPGEFKAYLKEKQSNLQKLLNKITEAL
jgi:hypothetical protein